MNESAVKAHVLSNGAYSVLVTPQGGGFAALNGYAITRWAPAPGANETGFFCYVRDLETGEYWSITEAPRAGNGAAGTTTRRGDSIVHEASCAGIEAVCEVFVAQNANAEVRRFRVTNRDARARSLDATTYAELALNTLAGDAGHPAFSKLFVQTGYDAQRQALFAWRRPRSPDDRRLVVAQRVIGIADWQFETSRAAVIGRTHNTTNPRVMIHTQPLAGTVGTVLDPVFCLRVPVRLEAGASVSFDVVTCAAESREAVEQSLDGMTDFAPASVSGAAAWGPLGLPSRWRSAIDTADAEYAWVAPAFVRGANLEEQKRTSFGGFSEDGSEYVLEVGGGLEPTPQPWVNVIANENFGCLISESGAGYTWAANSRENRVTHWSNDPVTDPPSETLYIRDAASEQAWSAFPGPGAPVARFEVRHGFGYSRFNATTDGLQHDTVIFVPRHDPVRIVQLLLTNRAAQDRTLAIASDALLVLGTGASETVGRVRIHGADGVLYATNRDRGEFSDRVAFTCATGGRNVRRNGRFGVAVDVTVPAGESRVVSFLLGEAEDEAAARACIARYTTLPAIDAALEHVRGFWRELLSAVRIQTPEPAFDVLLNGWLAYQNLALPDVGALGVLPVRRRVRVSRPAAGLVRTAVPRPEHHALADPAARGASVRGRRRAALVASAGQQGNPHAFLGRPALAALYHRRSTCARTGDAAVLDEVVRFVDGATA